MINESAIKGEPGTGFEPRIVGGVDKGPFECFNCEYFKNGNACNQEDMKKNSKKPRHANGMVVVSGPDCCEYVERLGKTDARCFVERMIQIARELI